eukprot:5132345-Pyramimonas_sp.AAC.2
MGGFWALKCPWRRTGTILIGLVRNALLSGPEALMVTPQQYKDMDAHLARLCRLPLQGRGASREGEHTTTRSNEQ